MAWLKGVLAAFIAGVAGGILLMLKDPHHFNLMQAQEMFWPCIGFGLVGMALYMVKSPFTVEKEKKEDALSQEALSRYQNRDKDRN